MKSPTRPYPFIIIGFCRRWERVKGDSPREVVDPKTKFYIWKDRSSERLGPSEMQKYTKWGFLLTWPLCFNLWFQIRPQIPNKPGSEIVPFLRLALWRWDPEMKQYLGPKACFIGTHWD